MNLLHVLLSLAKTTLWQAMSLFIAAQIRITHLIGDMFHLFGPKRLRGAIIDLAQVHRVLVVRLDEVGDVVLTTGFLRELRALVPQAEITLVVKPMLRDLMETCPYVDEVLIYNQDVRRIPLRAFVILAPMLFMAVVGLSIAQGSFVGFSEALSNFNDYFDTTARFLARFDEFGFLYGGGLLSDFWFYVPRGLYPDKPFEYGVLLIHWVLFPGMAAQGFTPGILPWALAYLDFGVVGVFCSGLTGALWQRIAYEHFLKHRQSFFAFVFMMQLAIWPVMTFAPLVFVIAWSVGLSVFLRLVWRSRHRIQVVPPDDRVLLMSR